jgi:hypothetical protein
MKPAYAGLRGFSNVTRCGHKVTAQILPLLRSVGGLGHRRQGDGTEDEGVAGPLGVSDSHPAWQAGNQQNRRDARTFGVAHLRIGGGRNTC